LSYFSQKKRPDGINCIPQMAFVLGWKFVFGKSKTKKGGHSKNKGHSGWYFNVSLTLLMLFPRRKRRD
jgi:hypothetical protein